ncbi:probable carboxylesterase 15 [Syzygium oleosum]|uniref:probable carboxylesterase 15 n=1 Tax=Syzygium oleosum TaxID=219896 RepID=UPI0024B8C51E|nr:probable carboxylesterase 15 [Syzygium oleosum]
MAGSSRADMVKDLGAIRIYGDGSVYRLKLDELDISAIPVMCEDSVCWKDFTYDEPRDLLLRIYKPKSTTSTSSDVHKLPIIVYLHGGGFCVGSREWPTCHNGCLRLTSSTGAVVVAPDFGLSPEHRVPAIFDNVIRAVRWIGGRAGDEWLSEGEGGRVEIDLERVFVVGDSSGGTVAHHLAVRLGSGSLNLDPIDVKGYVMISPFFGGVTRTGSEKDSTEPWLNLELLD